MNTNKTESAYPHRRRPWLAVFLSLIMPGMGHIYCGNMVRGIVIILLMTLFPLGWIRAMMINKPTPIVYCFVMWAIVLLTIVLAAIDAYRLARRTRFDYQLKDYNRWTTYLALIWIGGAGTLGYAIMIRDNMFEPFRVPSLSMAPTIIYNDRIIANKLTYRKQDPKRGDVVLFNQPDNLRVNNIKRIVALGGDTVEMKEGQLFINGEVLERRLVEQRTIISPEESVTGDVFWETNGEARYQIFVSEKPWGKQMKPDNFGPMTIPDYHCFVLGDNRRCSYDSRHFGTLSLGALWGRDQYIYWPPPHWANISPD